MSATKIIRLRCDVVGCDSVLLVEGSAIATRELAVKEGWDHRPTNKRVLVDICPEHGRQLKAGEKLLVKSSSGTTEIGGLRWSGWHKEPASVDILPGMDIKAHS